MKKKRVKKTETVAAPGLPEVFPEALPGLDLPVNLDLDSDDHAKLAAAIEEANALPPAPEMPSTLPPGIPESHNQAGPMGISLQIPLRILTQRILFLGVPMYGGQNAGMFCRSAIDLAVECAKMGIQLKVYFLFNESLITRARNYICDEFLRSGATHMLFIDSDIGFDPRDVLFMLSLMAADGQYDVMTAPYPKKTICWEKIVAAVNKGKADANPNDLEKYVGDFVFNPKDGGNIPIGAPAEVLEAGTGFMMIRKDVLEKFRDAFPKYLYRPDHVRQKEFDGHRLIHMFFQAEIDRTDFESLYRKALEDALAALGPLVLSPDDTKNPIEIINAALAVVETRSLRYLSEDYWFSQKLQELGMKVWLCPWMKTFHVGSYIFGGSLADLASIGANPTADAALLEKTKQK